MHRLETAVAELMRATSWAFSEAGLCPDGLPRLGRDPADLLYRTAQGHLAPSIGPSDGETGERERKERRRQVS